MYTIHISYFSFLIIKEIIAVILKLDTMYTCAILPDFVDNRFAFRLVLAII